jgi:ATP-dependent helicase HrpA
MTITATQLGKAADGPATPLSAQITKLALERTFLQQPWPLDALAFQTRLNEGRARLTLIAHEVARLAAAILSDYASAARKIRDSKNLGAAVSDATEQLNRLMPQNFLVVTPWTALPHVPRYLKAIVLRLDKCRDDPARDAAHVAQLRPLEQGYWRLVAERKGLVDEHMQAFRWLLEELRVSFFAQTLRTAQPVSVKRLEKAWSQLHA